MLELVALAVVLPMLALRRRTTALPVHAPSVHAPSVHTASVHAAPVHSAIVLPAMDVAPPRRRLARGSVEQRVTPMPEDLPRRPVIRPTHARR